MTEKEAIYLKCMKMTDIEKESLVDTGFFNDIIEGYLILFLNNEKIQVEGLHDKMKDLFDFHSAKEVKKLVK